MRLLILALLLLAAPAVSAQSVYDTADPMPTLQGGIGALQSAIVYPDEARDQGLSGRVLVSFVVDAEGRVAEATVLRGAHPLLNDAALDAVRQARFEPGQRAGAPVAVRMVLPISFALSAEAREERGQDGPGVSEAVAVQVDEMPRVIGGLDAVAERIVYPSEAEAAGIEGRVFVMFVVEASGAVVEAEVVEPVHPLLDEAALAAVRATPFQPGRHEGRPVRVQMVLPITFALPEKG